MNNKGVVRFIDKLGRLVIPKEIRKELGWNTNEPIEMIPEKDCVILRKYKAVCLICNKNIKNENDFVILNDKKICNDCINLIRK